MNGFEPEFINFVVYLVRNHSNKQLMTRSDTPLELILLMEADLLDETGALSVNYSYASLNVNPMVTVKAKEFWQSKQKLIEDFIEHLSYDLGIDSIEEESRLSYRL